MIFFNLQSVHPFLSSLSLASEVGVGRGGRKGGKAGQNVWTLYNPCQLRSDDLNVHPCEPTSYPHEVLSSLNGLTCTDIPTDRFLPDSPLTSILRSSDEYPSQINKVAIVLLIFCTVTFNIHHSLSFLEPPHTHQPHHITSNHSPFD